MGLVQTLTREGWVRQAVMIPHYSVLANVIQMAHFTHAKDDTRPLEMRRYKPGDKCLGRALLPPCSIRFAAPC